jgi:WD40 repeat protein/serine/threonine protein kinase
MRMEEQKAICFRSAAMPTADREEALFAAALEKPTRAERAAYLEGACGEDLALRGRIEALLAAHDAAGGVLDAPLSVLLPTAAYRPLTEGPGARIGPYKLLQQIGEGGMGIVYMAEQQEPVRRQVALKIIKPGLDSQQVIARFEAERQALALMDHQNIARVLDAGTTESGRPYFVMELVHGGPITQFCDDNHLTPRERLALFVPVCSAIQHAHQKGIIHRDLKPSNVLVTMYDDRPVPKVIDFGVAKAIEQRLTEKTLFTQYGVLVGTFEYMSPEQAEMNAFGVDTRSDVYSLGVLLYELLTGTTPLERTRLRAAALDELVRLIKEEEAPRPSVRLSTANNLPRIAAARKTEPAQLSKLVRGEIDWIVMKCLEKDRSRRYDTASGLARDVERYLKDEPVEACPPSTGYWLRKFMRKHRTVVATAACVLLACIVAAVGQTLNLLRAQRAEAEANQLRLASDVARQEAWEAKVEADNQRDRARFAAYAAGIALAQRAWEEDQVVHARELLEEVPREAAGKELRGFEWFYLHRLCHSEALTLKGHTSPVYGVAYSPDGQRLASASGDSTLKMWDSATGKELFCKHLGGPVMAVAFSPDGQRLASGGVQCGLRIWDSASGQELLSLAGHALEITSLAFSPDGQCLASASGDRTVKIWDSVTGQELRSLKGHARPVWCVAYSPDGQRLASASLDRTVKVWDSVTGQERFSLKGHDAEVMGVAFSPDGRRLASASADRTVKIWDSATGQELVSLKGHAGPVSRVAYSPDGQRLASGSEDRTVKVWDSVTGQELFSLKGHARSVSAVVYSPDGQRLASGSMDRTVRVWDSASGKEQFTRKGQHGRLTSVAFSPDSQRLAWGSWDQTVTICDRALGQELFSFSGGSSLPVGGVAFSPDGQRLASGRWDQTVTIWDCRTGKELLRLKGHAGPVASVVYSPDGQRLASASWDGTVKVWDSATGQEQFTLRGHTNRVLSVAFSPDSQRLASASWDGTVKVWDSTTGKELLALKGHEAEVNSVAFSPDGKKLASGSNDRTVRIWDSATCQELVILKGHDGLVLSVAFSPDGRRLASGSEDGMVKLWDSASGKELFSLKGSARPIDAVAFSPDGQCLACTNADGSLRVWETSISAETQDRRAARQLVADLFRQMGLRADVLERLRKVPGMSPSRRQEALLAAATHAENPSAKPPTPGGKQPRP